jgi:hypothetical protein
MKRKVLIFIAGLLFISLRVFAQDDVSIDSSGNVKTGVSNTNGNLEVTGGSGEHGIVGSSSGTGAAGMYGINTTYGNYGILGYDSYGVYGYSGNGYAGYFQGNARVTGNLTVDGTFTGNETDPQVGTLVNGKWCNSDGTQVNCNQSPPLLTESDPTVNALGKATLSCSNGQVAKWNGANWECANDIDTNTTYSAGTGLNLSGTAFNVNVPLSLSGSVASGGILTGANSDATGYGVSGFASGTYGRGVHGSASANTFGIGVYGSASGSSGNGVYGYASATGAVTNSGGVFSAWGDQGSGVFGAAGSTGRGIKYGGHFRAYGDLGRGVYGDAPATGAVTNYGVMGSASGNSGVGVWGYGAVSGTSYDFYAAGPGVNYGYASSIRWKRNVKDIDNALDKVIKLKGVYFDWDEEHGGQHDMGFIAEEVGKVIPEVVAYEPDGVYATGVDYGAITPMLVQAIKEQQEQIKQLKAEIEELKKRH